MKHIVSFSTGLSSALVVERVLNRYGKNDTLVVFMDTTIEDSDNYRFMRECKKRWDVDITVLTDGRDPYQVAKDAKIIPNQKIAPCTFKLKIELFTEWLSELDDAPLTVHIGYDYTELHRIDATKRNYEARGWSVDFPLLWKPYELRPYSDVVKYDWGIEPPRMYALGYSHANCGGVCVKQGLGDWTRTLINFPDRFEKAERWERDMRNHDNRKNYAILRDQSGGDVKPLTLQELRERHQSSQNMPTLFDLDTVSPCVVCGVGDLA